MKNRIVIIAITIVDAFLLSLLPVYPLWVEGRHITQTGESLYHEWQFVQLKEYYESYIYAQVAWQKATKVVYDVLAVVNPLIMIFISWFFASQFQSFAIKR